MMKNKAYYSDELKLHAYLTRGLYVDQLRRWNRLFPKERLLILSSDELFRNPSDAASKVFAFLDLKPYPVILPAPQNTSRYPERMGFLTHLRLRRFFKPHNRRLYQYLGRNFDW